MSLAVQYNPNRSMGRIAPLHGLRLVDRQQLVLPLPRQGASAQQVLHATLDLLTAAEEYMDSYARLQGAETTDSPTGRAETEESVAWMRSGLEDITATLIGIATHPAQ